MRGHRARVSAATWLWPLATATVMVAAAVALCRLGYLAVVANYDGALSIFNPVTVGSWFGAGLLFLLALPAAALVYETLTDR
ncbi:hypothetical protein AB0J74_19210 [Asanoa sp. NPDC049573]|uniref:hypothetical protein n=1 Tax=Asanoa sp. NPDC049573 TaxID=3155396 RepID=UPI003447D833